MNTIDIVGDSVVSSIIEKQVSFFKKEERKRIKKDDINNAKKIKKIEISIAYANAYKKLYSSMISKINLMDISEGKKKNMIEKGREDIMKKLTSKEGGCKKILRHIYDFFYGTVIGFFLLPTLAVIIFNLACLSFSHISLENENLLTAFMAFMIVPSIVVFILSFFVVDNFSIKLDKILSNKKCSCQKCLLKKKVISGYSRRI